MEFVIPMALGICALALILLATATRKPPYVASSDDVVLGTTTPPLSVPMTEVRLGEAEQKYHAYILGRSGSGKSRALESIFLQHLNRGRGVGILEPHHDLSFDTLSFLVEKGFFRADDSFEKLLYIDWGNGHFVPFNILASSQPPHVVALNTLDAMLRSWPELADAPAFQTLFLAAVTTLIAAKLPITFLHQLITDKPFRDSCLAQVTDPLVHQKFQAFDRLGRDQAQESGSLLRRAFLLSFSPQARFTLGQPENWLDFRRIMDEGRSLIINLGNIDDGETKKLIGSMLMVQIEQAALSRSDLLPSQRTPFTLLVDEWSSFAAQEQTIAHILSQCRKFNLRLYLAGQSVAQIDSRRLAGALENCRLQIAFGLGRDSAVMHSHRIAPIDTRLVKEEAATPNQHTQYFSVPEQFESWAQELQSLEPRSAYVKLEGKPPVRIKTVGVSDPKPNPAELERVVSTYRRLYQRSREEAEQAVASVAHAATVVDSPPTFSENEPAYTRVFNQGHGPNGTN